MDNSPTPDEIRALIESAGLSQPKASKMALVSTATFSRYLNGSSKMHPYIWEVFKQRIIGLDV